MTISLGREGSRSRSSPRAFSFVTDSFLDNRRNATFNSESSPEYMGSTKVDAAPPLRLPPVGEGVAARAGEAAADTTAGVPAAPLPAPPLLPPPLAAVEN